MDTFVKSRQGYDFFLWGKYIIILNEKFVVIWRGSDDHIWKQGSYLRLSQVPLNVIRLWHKWYGKVEGGAANAFWKLHKDAFILFTQRTASRLCATRDSTLQRVPPPSNDYTTGVNVPTWKSIEYEILMWNFLHSFNIQQSFISNLY